MSKETIIAKLRGTLDFTEEAQEWLRREPDVWFARDRGDAFFSEFSGAFSRIFIEAVESETTEFFLHMGLHGEHIPRVKVLETYRGSLIMEAAITMAGGMGTVYATIKAISELPKMADGLEDLKKRIQKRFHRDADTEAAEIVARGSSNRPYVATPPRHLLTADFTIDARPLRALQPDVAQAHKIHLSVAISRSGLVLENLGEAPMRDVRIGIFSSPSRRNQWSFIDSFSGLVSLLSPHQTISKRLEEFRDCHGKALDLDSGSAAYVDCWIQDEHGIYLFNFYLE
jgi:hypothetical protein